MKIAIAGAGTTGAYAHRLLRNQGFHVDLFDKEPKTACGLNPCAWGTSRDFIELTRAAGLEPENYILQRSTHVVMDEVRLKGDLLTFDKPALIKDLLGGTEIKHHPLELSAYDRVIDATGISRAFLPPTKRDILLPCVQFRVRPEDRLENKIKLGGVGYAWCFPLGRHGYHVGCGTLAADPNLALKEVGWLSKNPGWEVICACKGNVRLSGPHDSQPFVVDGTGEGVWGVGEAIGCVAPLAGDGVVPGMKSVRILLEHWDDPAAYTKAILKEFEWMKREREVIDKLLAQNRLGLKDAWVLKKNSRRMGMQVGLRKAFLLLKNLQ
ncbi:MAG: NAD(P)-binding protein [Proteobacteria bacterium]|nr:NAD(P)-binding protein [Pseudomonadota bacterium]